MDSGPKILPSYSLSAICRWLFGFKGPSSRGGSGKLHTTSIVDIKLDSTIPS